MPLSPLAAKFYDRPVLEVARWLLGARLVREFPGSRIVGIITETEAYDGEEDLACHARAGRTARTEIMYGPPGRAYIYFIYGIHWMLNCVTGPNGHPAAVLIRSIIPVEGFTMITANRPGVRQAEWTNGPARLCQALQIDGRLNGSDLTDPNSGLWIEAGAWISEEKVITGPRVGIDRTPEPWRSKPWRFRVKQSAWQPSDAQSEDLPNLSGQ